MPIKTVEEKFRERFVQENPSDRPGWEGTYSIVGTVEDIVAFFLSHYSELVEGVEEIIRSRIMASKLLIESAERGEDLEDGWSPEERIEHEESIKIAMESLLEEIREAFKKAGIIKG